MISFFAETAQPTGIGAFNINLKSFLFQLVTFIIVLLIFRKWILPPINRTLDQRRQTLEKSLKDAKATEAALAEANAKAEEILAQARSQADETLAEARRSGEAVIAKAEEAAGQRAASVIKEGEERLSQERSQLRQELRTELAGLVADATAKVVEEKVDAKRDQTIIERAIRSITS